MKQQLLLRRAGIIGTICLLIISLSSCLKDKNDYVEVPAALISAINASPDAQPLDFYLDNNRGNYFPIKSGESMDYIRAFTGKRNASFNLYGSTQKIKTDTMTLRKDRFYSLFLCNVVSTPDYLLIADSVARPASGMATVRFVNVSPNAGAADLVIQGGATIATGKTYRTYSAFVPVQGNKTYTFEVRQGGNVLSIVSNVSLRAGSMYTVWLQGVSGGTTQTGLSAHIQDNVDYY
ncbi:DUF4397 domain-containing protein [Mucilaginibacter sp. RS28]|uniref:DUF4397 domain-containing protein n=1 Tax=Mucilaginibacter straminoryzae TaxID=2932774 RepID=A0A9X1WZ33_9SPHI|nr:DUF4397 domain-containing protein [Mucilaginibacter straminoryzae]MCJ8208179.1 DUF4397 domain-containing protein [Mucilaginibacter straminoryzae]